MQEIKVILLGNTTVGKTSLIIKYIKNEFSFNYLQTLGLDFKQKIFKMKNGKDIRLRIFDTAGQERFKSVSFSFIKKANGIILLYDIGNKNSFEAVDSWMESIKDNADKKIPIILVGNKCDINDEKRKVTFEEGEKKGKEFQIPFFETSCKDGINVKEVFERIVNDIILKKNQTLRGELKLFEDSIKKKNCC